MAKITSELAERQVGNKFAMVLLAAQRAREINAGSAPRVKTNYSGAITALMELEQGLIDPELYNRIASRRLPRLRSVK